MPFFKCCFSAVILFTIYWQDPAAEANLTNIVIEAPQINNLKENDINKLPVARPLEFVSIKKLVLRNSTSLKKESEKNFTFETSPDSKQSATKFGSEQKREIENGTFDPFKPLFLFPILPFLFPPKDDSLVAPEKNEFSGGKNDTKAEVSRSRSKPFIFFDFAFNIRQIPLKNGTDRLNDSKIINVKKLSVNKADLKKKSRKRRNTKRIVPDFFDDTPLFPDSELDEFLPKPDLFFPDLSFHPKPVKKLSRRKRDEKKPDVKNDLKFFFDAFDEAFTQTRKELERTDPILNFIKGMESSFGEEKKDTDDFFNRLSDTQDNSNMKWKIQRNVKRLSDDHLDDLAKNPESPMIIVDKVVKIGEFHLHDDKNDGKKSKRKKKRITDLKRKSLEDGVINGETGENNIFDMLKQEQPKETKKWKRNHHPNPKEKGGIITAVESKEIQLLPGVNTSYVSVGSNITIETKNKKPLRNATDVTHKYEHLLKAMDSIRDTFKADFIDGGDKFKRKTTSGEAEKRARKASYDDLKKNITEVLNQFLTLVTKEDSVGSPQEGGQDQDDLGVFDWTEKEILDSLGARHKKDAEFPAEYVDTEKERQVADLNFLFLTVTLPTILVFTSVLLVCFFSLRVKGKICTKLFNPRQVYVVEDEMSSASKPLKKEAKPQNI